VWIGIVLMPIPDPDPASFNFKVATDPDPTPSFTDVGESEKIWLLFKAVPKFKLFYPS
jgi:hypothetical protein